MTAISALFPPGPMQRLVDRLPGLRRETLAEVICGHLIPQHDCPSSHFHVLNALIAHVGTAGNRVWPSYTRLAALVNEKLAAAGRKGRICAKTAKRAVQYWIKNIGLRVIDDQEELLAGPGEHDYIDAGRKKKGDGPVNHYDLSSLEAQVPTDLVHILDLLVSSGDYKPLPLPPPEPPRDIDARYPDPFAPQMSEDPFREEAETCPLKAPVPSSDDLPEDLQFDPFAADAQAHLGAESSLDPSPVPAIPLQKTPHETLMSPCNASIKPESGSRKKAPSEAARPTRFDGTNLSGIRDQNPRAREGAPPNQTKQAQSSSGKQATSRERDRSPEKIDRLAAGYRALAAARVGQGVRKQIVTAMGDAWASEVALYAQIQDQKGQIQKTKAAYIHGVFSDWQQDRKAGLSPAWPDWLQDRIKRERAAAAQVVRDQAEGNIRKVVVPPLPLPTPPKPEAANPIAALPEGERQALEDRARAELRREYNHAPDVLIRNLLPARMRAIYDRERKGQPLAEQVGRGESNCVE